MTRIERFKLATATVPTATSPKLGESKTPLMARVSRSDQQSMVLSVTCTPALTSGRQAYFVAVQSPTRLPANVCPICIDWPPDCATICMRPS